MFVSGVQLRIRLDSRLKHAGMTDLGSPIDLTQQAAGNEPVEIQRFGCEKLHPQQSEGRFFRSFHASRDLIPIDAINSNRLHWLSGAVLRELRDSLCRERIGTPD